MFGLFKAKDKSKTDFQTRYLDLTVREVIPEAPDAITIVFEKPYNTFTYKPGQYLTLILPLGESEVRRSYSLCTNPLSDPYPAITVKRVEEGLASNYLNKPVKAGDKFRALEPMGSFTPELNASAHRLHVFIGGGSGITPLFSMIKSILQVEKQSQVLLLYQNRDAGSIIFRAALEELAARNPQRLEVVHVLSRPSSGWPGITGRLDEELMKAVVYKRVEGQIRESLFYLCGPQGLMQIAEETLFGWKVAGNQILKESFVASAGKGKQMIDANAEPEIINRQVTIILDGEEHQVMVPAGKSILQSALDMGIDMPFSCQSGLCTACRGKLLNGKVYMEEDDGLTDSEIQEGYVLNCVGHPLTSDVRIEVG